LEQFKYKNNVFCCEGVHLKNAAEQFGTPLYVYSKQSVIDHCRWIENAFGPTDHLSCYAVKANSNKEILRLLAHEGIGADAGSVGEMQLALQAGFFPDKVTFSGVGKRDDEIEYALKNNIMALYVESGEELHIINSIAQRLNTRARILLRVNFDLLSETHPYITTGQKHNKFGVDCSSAILILQEAKTLSNIDVLGIHSHIGSQITKVETFINAAHTMVKFVGELHGKGIAAKHLDFGGGFGVQYHDYVTHPLLPVDDEHPEAGITTVNMLTAALPVLQEANCKILIQPGRSIVAHAGILLTKILYIKSTSAKTFVIVDAGMNDLIRPSLYQSYHQIVPLQLRESPHKKVDIVGPLCESGDFFALDRPLQDMRRGEFLAILCAGAYGYVLSSNYNGRPRPAEVLVDGSQMQIIREREKIDSL
jgi:diaminopimelate decarboxylase